MGRSSRQKPRYLAEKLLQIRTRLDLSQTQMVKRLGATELKLKPGHISQFETGAREPSLLVLLRYSEISGVVVNLLIDDEQKLPETLPCEVVFEWVMVKKEIPRTQS
jgi:transcriptional regulator with XRE-family HTH domain